MPTRFRTLTAEPHDYHDAFAPPDTFGSHDPFEAIGAARGRRTAASRLALRGAGPAAWRGAGAARPAVELPDLGAVVAHGTDAVPSPEVLGGPEPATWPAPPPPSASESDSDHGIAFEPEPVDFSPAGEPDLSPDLPLGAGLGAEHGPDLVPAIEPPASAHVSPDVPVRADDPALDDDAEIDLTGVLNALAKNGVSISEALDSVMPAPPSNAVAGQAGAGPAQADVKFGGLPAGAEAFTAPGAGPVAGAAGKSAKDAAHANGAGEETDLERVFDGLRNQAAGDMVEMAQPDQSVRLLSMADTYQAAGMFEEARAALEQVASDSRHRFRAAASLGRLFWQQGDADASLRWMQLASEAPAPDPEAGRALLYELGEKLEQTGETTRALAVFLELLGEQEGYRDVQQRVDRLSRVQAEQR